jgi:drug/metabolite transporter (DMT)-like permease
VSTVIFSALSFLGVVSAYVFGWLGANEVPNMTQLLGALAIIVANTVLVSKENN